MYTHQKDNKFRHFLRQKARSAERIPQRKIDYTRVPDVIEIFDINLMYTMLKEHGSKSNLYRNHQRYIDYLGDSSGFLPLAALPDDIFEKLEDLRLRFPNFSEAIDYYREQFALARLADNAAFFANPLLLSGPAGVGKTAFCHELARAVDTHFELIGLSSTTAGFVISGMSSGWAEGKPGKVVEALARGRKGNPMIVVDEIDKAGGDKRHDPLGGLYQLLEKETAAKFVDEALEIATNCAHIVWIGTANELDKIAAPILSRFSVIEISSPSPAHMQQVLRSIYQKVRKNHPWGQQFSEELPAAVVSKIIASGLEPRLVQKELISACGKAVLRQSAVGGGSNKNGYELSPDDFISRDTVNQQEVSVVVMPIYTVASALEEPEISISEWSVHEVSSNDRSDKTQHLVGFIASRGSGRVTSAIQSFDRDRMCIKTNSGRLYHLEGQPGSHPDVDYVWSHWKKLNDIQEELDVTSRYWRVH